MGPPTEVDVFGVGEVTTIYFNVTKPPFDNLLVLALHAGLPGWSTFLLATLPQAAGLLLALLGLTTLGILTRRGVKVLAERGVAWQPFAAFAVLD